MQVVMHAGRNPNYFALMGSSRTCRFFARTNGYFAIVSLGTGHGHKRSPAGISAAIPRSANPGRIAQNIDLFDFALTTDEVASITALDTGAEQGVDSDTDGH